MALREILFTIKYKGPISEDITTLKTKTKTKDIDKTIPKTKDMDKIIPKTEHKDMLDKINNKVSTINETSTILAEIKVKLKKKYKLIYESMCELQDEIYNDDLWLRQVE